MSTTKKDAGIISEPKHPGRYYYIRDRKKGEAYFAPNRWIEHAEKKEGSWWQSWHVWLVQQDSLKRIKPPMVSSSLPEAPGEYVLQK